MPFEICHFEIFHQNSQHFHDFIDFFEWFVRHNIWKVTRSCPLFNDSLVEYTNCRVTVIFDSCFPFTLLPLCDIWGNLNESVFPYFNGNYICYFSIFLGLQRNLFWDFHFLSICWLNNKTVMETRRITLTHHLNT